MFVGRALVFMVLLPETAVNAFDAATEQAESLYRRAPEDAESSEKLMVIPGVVLLPVGPGVIDTNVTAGAVVSMTIAFCPAILPADPVAGSVRVAEFPAVSAMVPPFSVKAPVDE